MKKRDEFSSKVKLTVSQRAGFICSNPMCTRLTVGPVITDDSLASSIGVVSHICAASPGGPRYDYAQTETERKNIKNAIYLCASCSVLIDKNNGLDYPKQMLLNWKNEHERVIKKNLEGEYSLFITINNEENSILNEAVSILEDKGSLFAELYNENIDYVMISIGDIRKELTKIRGKVKNKNYRLEKILGSILNECRTFMNTTSNKSEYYEFTQNLINLRKSIGIILFEIEKEYKIIIEQPLKTIIPSTQDVNRW